MQRARRALLLIVLLVPSTGWVAAGARAVAGATFGLVAGTFASAGVIVARSRFQNHYMESVREVMSWQGAAVPMGGAAGGVAGAAGGGVLAGVVLGSVGGAAVGAAAGAAVGSLVSDDGQDRWAGGTIGGAIGLVLGFVLGWVLARRRPHRGRGGGSAGGSGGGSGSGSGAGGGPGAGPGAGPGGDPGGGTGRGGTVAAAGVLAALLLGGCGADEPVKPGHAAPAPGAPGAAEDVVILVGDPGKARFRRYPVFPRVAAEVDAWASEIGRDSAVTVVILGDIVYPDGMHERGTPGYGTDSARVADQVDMVRTPVALEHDARMYFVAGNHDWGLREDQRGARRLRNLGEFLDRAREGGANVDLKPPAGSGVPDVEDIGERLRLILLDTAWWLFDAEPLGKDAMIRGVANAMAGAGGRQVVIAAHHPWESAGPHGGLFPVWQTLGLRRILYKSGALLQDLESRPYRDLRRRLGAVFLEHGRPLAFVGGHEHSLQVISHDDPTAPRYSIVSGSASKLTGIGLIEGTVYQASAPGYVTLVVRENGAVDVEVVGAPEEYLSCPENEPVRLEWERCMEEGEEAFETLFAARLAQPIGS